MGSSQKYSLKWNDFTSNVAYTFRDLHSRQDFVDVTLACSDGSTLEAHKVILSSVSSYFKDILKTTPCKHPIIILKDTGREEAQAMLEFAYTGEVNVGQDLLPTLLHTARSYRIKGLDKVETPVDPLHGGKSQTPSSEHWGESAPPTRSHTPSSVHSQHEIGRPIANGEQRSSPPNFTNNGFLLNRERDMQPNSTSPTSLPSSQPPTREASPAPTSHGGNVALSNSRTPPPKRWKRSFDMTHPINKDHHQPLPLIAEKYFPHNRVNEYDSHGPKRFCEPSQTANGDLTNGSTNGNAENGRESSRSVPYPHSMPTSPTMFERGNETRLAGLFRHHLSNDLSRGIANGISDGKTNQQPSSTTSPGDNALDYRCFSNGQTKIEPHDEYLRQNGVDRRSPEETERFRRGSITGFRPESAPTVLDMSPEGSLSGPPSIRDVDGHKEEDIHNHFHNGDEANAEYVSKGYPLTPDAMGRYTCDECGKIFKHPGSLQHHRHIHRGTHRCPSCGKVFSRRWDMERHLNKSKYGCPANRFSTGSSGSSSAGSSERGGVSVSAAPLAVASAVTTAAAHLEMLAHASSVASHPAAAAAAAAVAVAANSAAAATNHNGTA